MLTHLCILHTKLKTFFDIFYDYSLNPCKKIVISLVSLRIIPCSENSPRWLTSTPFMYATSVEGDLKPGTITEKETALASDFDMAILHRVVLCLGWKGVKTHSATWTELLSALESKDAYLSREKLQKIISHHKALFTVVNDSIQLCKLNQNFVREYLMLAQGVKTVEKSEMAQYSMSEPCKVKVTKSSFIVRGLVCQSDSEEANCTNERKSTCSLNN